MNIIPHINNLISGGGKSNGMQDFTLAVDDNLSPLEKCKRYVFSTVPLQRMAYVKDFADTARKVGIATTVRELVPLLPRMARDEEGSIRQEVGQTLVSLCTFFAEDKKQPSQQQIDRATEENTRRTTSGGIAIRSATVNEAGQFIVPLDRKDLAGPIGYQTIKAHVMPVLHLLLVDQASEVRNVASEALCAISAFFNEGDVAQLLLNLVLCLAHDDRDDQKTTAVHLMAKLSPLFGTSLCQSFIAMELMFFSDDSTFRVRKATAQTFGQVCKTVGTEFTVQKMLPHFLSLSRDLIWGVRKGCVESLVDVASVVPDEIKRNVLLPMFNRFRTDCSRWVRNGAFEILGRFLHTLGPDLVDEQTLQMYTQIPQMTHYSNVDAEVNFFCAFNFPAVTITVGRSRWAELVDCYKVLAQDSKFPVRRSIASSLHQISRVVGPSLTERDILPVLNAFLADLDEVKQAALKNLGDILAGISQPRREAYASVLKACQMDKQHWRTRACIARQFDQFSMLFDAKVTATHIMPLFFALLVDGVNRVRDTIAEQSGVLLRRLAGSLPELYARTEARLLQLAHSSNYQHRKTFIRVAHGALGVLDKKAFTAKYLPALTALSQDDTPNVRLLVASLLHHLDAHPSYIDAKTLADLRTRLGGDRDRDVKYYSSKQYGTHLTPRDGKAAASLRAATDRVIQEDLKFLDGKDGKALGKALGKATVKAQKAPEPPRETAQEKQKAQEKTKLEEKSREKQPESKMMNSAPSSPFSRPATPRVSAQATDDDRAVDALIETLENDMKRATPSEQTKGQVINANVEVLQVEMNAISEAVSDITEEDSLPELA